MHFICSSSAIYSRLQCAFTLKAKTEKKEERCFCSLVQWCLFYSFFLFFKEENQGKKKEEIQGNQQN